MEAPQHIEPNPKEEPKPTPRRRRRWPWVLLGVLLIVFALVVIAIPAYLSSGSFRQMVQAKVSQATGGTLNIGGLSVGWLRGVRISEVKFRDATGWATVAVGDLDTHPSLASLLGGTVSLGQTVIDRPTIEIDLRKRPAPAPAAAGVESKSSSPAKSSGPVLLPVVGDMTIRDGALRVTDLRGRTVDIARVNTTVSMRPAGQTSQVTANMAVSDAIQPASIRAQATVTPSKSEGWSLKGTTGKLTVEVNDLDLGTLNGLLELAGVKVETDGRLSGNVEGNIDNGNVQNVTAAINGRNILVGGEALKGDKLQTSKLIVNTKIAPDAGGMRVDQLQAQTDWASLSATGTVPTGARNMGELVKSTPPLNLRGNFQCDLARVLSQLPKTLSVKPGTKFTAGKASGQFSAVTQNGMADVTAHAEVAGLTGSVEGKPLTLSAPVIADARLTGNEKTLQVQTLDVTSSFAKVTASGDLSKVNYDGQLDLAKLQAELGQFVNLGSYRLRSGQFTANGQASITDAAMGTTGTATIQQFILNIGDGNSISEPSAQIRYAVSLDKAANALAVTNTGITAGFGTIDVPKATIPLQANSTAPMQADLAVQAVDLKKVAGYGAVLGFMPKTLDLSGTANSRLSLSGQKDIYRIRIDSTTIDNLRLAAAGKKPFEQKQVTLRFAGQINPNKDIAIEDLQLDSPAVKARIQASKTTQGVNTTLHALLQGQVDWAATGKAASVFLPEGLELSGNKDIALDLTSTYPTAKPDALPANLNGTISAAIDSGKYMGLNIGPTKVNIGIEKGLAKIAPINTTLNKGQFNFAAQANLAEKPVFLRTTQPLALAKGVQIDTVMTETLLKHVNPLFANATAVSGVVNFDCQQLAIPLEGGMSDRAALTGTFSADSVDLDAAGLLTTILDAVQQRRGQRMVIHPTHIVLKESVVRYDNMQVDVGNNPINFGGAIGPKGKLDMTVTLPWTFQGRTARTGREGAAGARVPVPLRGTVDRPEIDLGQFLQQGLLKGLENLLTQ